MALDDIENIEIFNIEDWQDVELEVLLDSGCSRHVLPARCAPGYQVKSNDLSKMGHKFQVGNGQTVPNEGEVSLNLALDTGHGEGRVGTSVFQVAELMLPLMSVGQICNNGHTCTFHKDHALIVSSDGEVLCKFRKERGVYIGSLKLKAPAPFGGQAP